MPRTHIKEIVDLGGLILRRLGDCIPHPAEVLLHSLDACVAADGRLQQVSVMLPWAYVQTCTADKPRQDTCSCAVPYLLPHIVHPNLTPPRQPRYKTECTGMVSAVAQSCGTPGLLTPSKNLQNSSDVASTRHHLMPREITPSASHAHLMPRASHATWDHTYST